MNPYLDEQGNASEALINTLNYLGISLERFKQMNDNSIRQLIKKYYDVLNDGNITKTKPHDGNLQPLDTNNQGWGFKRLPYDNQDSGSFSRYFSLDNWWQERIKKLPDEVKKVFPFLIVPKASTNEKQEGLDGFDKKKWIEGLRKTSPRTVLGLCVLISTPLLNH